MPKIIALTNFKGGVAKSTSTRELAHALVNQGKKVLAVDADPQGSLTILFDQDPRSLQYAGQTLYYSLVKNKPFSSILIDGNPALIPSSIILHRADRELLTMMRYSSSLLGEKLREVQDNYDVVLIDCPPNLTIPTISALVAADMVIIPVKTDLLSEYGIPILLEEIEEVRERDNIQLRIFGVLPTIHNPHYNQDKEALEALRSTLAQHDIAIFDPVARSTNFEKAVAEGKPTGLLYPETPGVDIYKQLANQIINHG